MQAEPLSEKENRLAIFKLVDVGLNGVDPPLAVGCDVQQPKDGPGDDRQRHAGDDGFFNVAQKDVGEGGDDGEHGHLLCVPGAEQHQ